MKTIYVLIVLLLFCSILYSQEQIDSLVHKKKTIDPAYQQLIYDYRIPDWGYHRLYANFTSRVSGQELDSKDISYETNYLTNQVSPYYVFYSTSEKSTLNIESMMNSYFRRSENKEQRDRIIQKYKSDDISWDFTLAGNLNQYVTRLLYLNFDMNSTINYDEDINKNTTENETGTTKSKDTNIQRFYQVDSKIGAGIGRIRNVNPIVRAIRFNERLKDINPSSNLNESVIKDVATLYTKQPAYNSSYDRSKKYFYEALPESALSQINNIKPWEVIYLDEVFNEILGDRYEGFELDGGFSVNHEHLIYSSSSNDVELTLLGLYVEQQYYHNFSTNYQFGTNLYASYSKAVNENTYINYFGRGYIRFLNLYNLSDRLLAQFNLSYETGLSSTDENTDTEWERQDRYNVNLSLDYFLENNLVLEATISNNVYDNWPSRLAFEYEGIRYRNSRYQNNKSWSIDIGLRYYFIRGLL